MSSPTKDTARSAVLDGQYKRLFPAMGNIESEIIFESPTQLTKKFAGLSPDEKREYLKKLYKILALKLYQDEFGTNLFGFSWSFVGFNRPAKWPRLYVSIKKHLERIGAKYKHHARCQHIKQLIEEDKLQQEISARVQIADLDQAAFITYLKQKYIAQKDTAFNIDDTRFTKAEKAFFATLDLHHTSLLDELSDKIFSDLGDSNKSAFYDRKTRTSIFSLFEIIIFLIAVAAALNVIHSAMIGMMIAPTLASILPAVLIFSVTAAIITLCIKSTGLSLARELIYCCRMDVNPEKDIEQSYSFASLASAKKDDQQVNQWLDERYSLMASMLEEHDKHMTNTRDNGWVGCLYEQVDDVSHAMGI